MKMVRMLKEVVGEMFSAPASEVFSCNMIAWHLSKTESTCNCSSMRKTDTKKWGCNYFCISIFYAFIGIYVNRRHRLHELYKINTKVERNPYPKEG